jgi:hypothetical protein
MARDYMILTGGHCNPYWHGLCSPGNAYSPAVPGRGLTTALAELAQDGAPKNILNTMEAPRQQVNGEESQPRKP